MPPDEVKAHPERDETDTSLREERAKTDKELASHASSVEADADHVVDLAREQADRALEASRDEADAAPGGPGRPSGVGRARASEDDAITDARNAADDRLHEERAAQKEALSALLALERGETDERLLMERTHADHSVASRDDFLGIVSHDARGILAGIAMSADVLLRLPVEGAVGERTRVQALRIQRLTTRMNRLIADLLDVVSMELGMLSVDTQQNDAGRLVAETIDSFQLAAAAQNISMTVEVPSDPIFATFDHDRLLQVLTNLVSNAMKFTADGGSIILGLAPTADGLRFTVRDTGCGIDTERLGPIFERFSQGAQIDRRGLGLGLYISRCIVEAHGGKIWAESELGNGSAFHFTLPTTLG